MIMIILLPDSPLEEFPHECRLELEHFFWQPSQSEMYQKALQWCELNYHTDDYCWQVHSATYVIVGFKHLEHAVLFALTCTGK